MTKVLVTGGLGFIGSHTVDLLIAKGHDVVVLDNLEMQVHMGKMPRHKNSHAKYILGDIRHRKYWLKALKGVNSVIHLAGAVGVGQSFWQARKYIDVNAGGTATMFDVIIHDAKLKSSIEKIVVASSKSLYGEGAYRCAVHGMLYPEQRTLSQMKKKEWEVRCPVCGGDTIPVGIPEEKPPQNLSPYALSKYATERLAIDFSYALGIPTVALRYFNVYGPRQSLNNPYTGVIAIFLSRIMSGNSPFLFEDGMQMRDYVYAEDVARVNVSSLTKGEGIYNVGTGKPHTLLDIVALLNKATGLDIEPFISGEFRPGDNRHDFADIGRLTRDFGTISFTEFNFGIRKLVEWSASARVKDLFEREERERKRFLAK